MYIVQIIIFFPLTIVGEFKILSIKKEKKRKEKDMMLLFCTHTYIH